MQITVIMSTSIGVGVLLIIVISFAFFVAVKVLLAKIKSNVQSEVQVVVQGESCEEKIYDEIHPIENETSGSQIHTEDNSAYGHIHTATSA